MSIRKTVSNHRLRPTQWGLLLAIYIFCYIWYVGVDLSHDGIIDMNGHGFFIVMVVIASIATMYYALAGRAYRYTA